ncbi:MAG: DUF547 domain-containing protein [Candidatus Omnitrophica bacterium]|nr:DUF547 domain-containing protein [Candidatus Omnitrophota bacterium]
MRKVIFCTLDSMSSSFHRWIHPAVLVLALVFYAVRTPQASALEQPFDHSAWSQFLETFVNDLGEVDYEAVRKDRGPFDRYLKQLSQINNKEFETSWPREERMAVLINAYHAGIIQAVVDSYPIRSIQDIPGIWNIEFIRIGTDFFSLNRIRRNDLVNVFRDEKIHMALSCGAKGGPKLRREAYTGARVEGQLFLAARDFVNDPLRNRIIPGNKNLELSPIFKWYGMDFVLDFGSYQYDGEGRQNFSKIEMSVLSFLVHYLDDSEKISYLKQSKYKITYLPFDWSLNDWKRSKANE